MKQYYGTHKYEVNAEAHTINGKPNILDPIFQGYTEYYYEIPGYPDYSISNFHQVRSNASGKVLKKYVTHHGNSQTHVYIRRPFEAEYEKMDVYKLFKMTWFVPNGYSFYRHEEVIDSNFVRMGWKQLPKPEKLPRK